MVWEAIWYVYPYVLRRLHEAPKREGRTKQSVRVTRAPAMVSVLYGDILSHSATKSAVLRALLAENTPVVALKGEWGAGKTHLWHALSDELTQNHNFSVLYLSALAFKSVDDLKTGLVMNILARGTGVKVADATGKVAPVAAGLAGAVAESGTKLVEIAKYYLPQGLQVRMSDAYVMLPKLRGLLPTKFLIAIDDIERTDQLDIGQLLGFVNFLVEELKVQLVLILNTEQLQDNRLQRWNQMREKIVSRTIGLEILPEEAADIALRGLPEPEAAVIKEFLLKLKVCNIRIIQHIRRNWQMIRGTRTLESSAVPHLVKSVVLLTALHEKATSLKDWPDVKFVLDAATHIFNTEDEQTNDWQEKLHQYGFGYADTFEHEVLVPFLESGHLDDETLDAYLAEIQLHIKRQEIDDRIRRLGHLYHWDKDYSYAVMKDEVNAILGDVRVMTARQASDLANIAGWEHPDLPNEVVDQWIGEHRPIVMKLDLSDRDDNSFNQLHPRIAKLYSERRDMIFPPLSVVEAIKQYRINSGYGARERRAILETTCSQYEDLIRNAPADERKELFLFFEKIKNGRVSGTEFGPAADLFFQAVATILTAQPHSRLSVVIQRALKASGLEVQGNGVRRIKKTAPVVAPEGFHEGANDND